MKSDRQKYSLILNIFITTVFVYIFYSPILLSPNSHQFSEKGDAIKNYYTYAYYINNNTDAINFEGLNYPYGEHFLYTDCTPVLSVSLKLISNIYPGISNYSVGILNFLLIISFLISSFLIYLILKEFDINHWLAAISAFVIMLLSPQIFRLTGHLALGFGFFLPLTWYLFIKFEKSHYSVKYSFWLFISLLITFYIHAYLGMIAASFLFAYAIVKLIHQIIKEDVNIAYYIKLFLIIFLPIIIFRVFIYITDTHYGRTDNPWGFFEAHTNIESVFLPIKRPFKEVSRSVFGNVTQIWEGWAYIGLSSILAIIFYFSLLIKKWVNHKKFSFNQQWIENKHLQYAIIASILLLIFSMAYPFKLYKPSLDWFSVLKQFRAVGRFAWVFYFVITISSVYFIDIYTRHLRKNGKKILSILVTVVFIGLFFFEGLPYHQDISERIGKSNNMFDRQQLDENFISGLDSINPDDYQAIIPLPFYYIGSENFGKTASDKIYLISQLFSYHNSLPILGSYLTRTSIWESKNIVQTMSPGFYEKNIIPDIKSDKPFLIIFSKEELSEYEKSILNRAKPISKNNEFELYAISKNDLFKNTTQNEIEFYYKIKSKLTESKGFLTSDTNAFLYFDGFDDRKSTHVLSGGGALSGPKKNYHILASFDAGTFKVSTKYTASFWMYNQGENFGQDMLNSMFILQEKDADNSKWSKIVDPMNSLVINDDWTLVEMPFEINNPNAKITLMIKGNEMSRNDIYIDNFMIYKHSSLNYYMDTFKNTPDSVIVKNNQRILIK